MLKEFKQFALKGNMLELAVAVVVGGSFGKIITSLVNDIIMPPIGLLLTNINFRDLYLNLSGKSFETLEAAKAAGAPTINYGLFLNTVIDFLIVAFILFLVIRAYNKVKPAPAAPTSRECPYCLSQVALKATRCPHCTSQLE